MNDEDVPSFVTDLRDDDVLVGRGAGIVRYKGNVRFRKLINNRKEEYNAATRRKAKDGIAREIVQSIKSRGGRFLKRLDSLTEARQLGVPIGVQAWLHVEETAMVEKIKQAMRDANREDLHDDESNVQEGGDAAEAASVPQQQQLQPNPQQQAREINQQQQIQQLAALLRPPNQNPGYTVQPQGEQSRRRQDEERIRSQQFTGYQDVSFRDTNLPQQQQQSQFRNQSQDSQSSISNQQTFQSSRQEPQSLQREQILVEEIIRVLQNWLTTVQQQQQQNQPPPNLPIPNIQEILSQIIQQQQQVEQEVRERNEEIRRQEEAGWSHQQVLSLLDALLRSLQQQQQQPPPLPAPPPPPPQQAPLEDLDTTESLALQSLLYQILDQNRTNPNFSTAYLARELQRAGEQQERNNRLLWQVHQTLSGGYSNQQIISFNEIQAPQNPVPTYRPPAYARTATTFNNPFDPEQLTQLLITLQQQQQQLQQQQEQNVSSLSSGSRHHSSNDGNSSGNNGGSGNETSSGNNGSDNGGNGNNGGNNGGPDAGATIPRRNSSPEVGTGTTREQRLGKRARSKSDSDVSESNNNTPSPEG